MRVKRNVFLEWFMMALAMTWLAFQAAPRHRHACSSISCFPESTSPQVGSKQIAPESATQLVAFQPPAAPPALEFPESAEWINTRKALKIEQLRGKFVLLDFWTYCCINCMHLLPVLKQAEEEFENELVVIGVHTAKFDAEKQTENVREAVLRYQIRHPVFNDKEQVLWQAYGVNTWPTLVLIDPQGRLVWAHRGEIPYRDLQKVLKREVAKAKEARTINLRPVHFELAEYEQPRTPLSYPGKVLATPDRIWIADSNHHRLVAVDANGQVMEVVGCGLAGLEDGSFQEARFRSPQGMIALDKNRLMVADTENHALRIVDLEQRMVHTIAGTGVQAQTGFPGVDPGSNLPKRWNRKPLSTAVASPWDLLLNDDSIYIAMAGTHQIWKMPKSLDAIGPWAGNGREDIVDGPRLPSQPYGVGSASFAQPSGLASDGQYLYVADSEGSSIRSIDLMETGEVSTPLGTANLPAQRLFTFGDQDGALKNALLQHPLAVAWDGANIWIADTYNHSIKRLNLENSTIETVWREADGLPLNEPAGLSYREGRLYIADTNNHRLLVGDVKSGAIEALEIHGLQEPERPAVVAAVKFPTEGRQVGLKEMEVTSGDRVRAVPAWQLPEGWKINSKAPARWVAEWSLEKVSEPSEKRILSGTIPMEEGTPAAWEFSVPEGKLTNLRLAVSFHWCSADDQGLCYAETLRFQIPVKAKEERPAKESVEVLLEGQWQPPVP
jgi:thiol-disulfide isomerase/thioredoxin